MLKCEGCAKYKAIRQPRNNCQACWFMYFKTNPGRVLAIDQGMSVAGKAKVESVAGTKFLKFYNKFKKAQDAIQN